MCAPGQAMAAPPVEHIVDSFSGTRLFDDCGFTIRSEHTGDFHLMIRQRPNSDGQAFLFQENSATTRCSPTLRPACGSSVAGARRSRKSPDGTLTEPCGSSPPTRLVRGYSRTATVRSSCGTAVGSRLACSSTRSATGSPAASCSTRKSPACTAPSRVSTWNYAMSPPSSSARSRSRPACPRHAVGMLAPTVIPTAAKDWSRQGDSNP